MKRLLLAILLALAACEHQCGNVAETSTTTADAGVPAEQTISETADWWYVIIMMQYYNLYF